MNDTRTIPINRIVRFEQVIVVLECARCSIDFGIGQDFQQRRRDDHADFYCPNGHANVYNGRSEAEKLREQVARLRTAAQDARTSEQFHRDRAAHERRSAAAVRGHLTRLRNRIANGVCPCCTRSFENVRRHIEGQHPTWIAEHPEALAGAVR